LRICRHPSAVPTLPTRDAECEEGVVGDHRGQRAAVVVTELAHDRQREAQPSGTLLHTVN
jgi:hypothetical protein